MSICWQIVNPKRNATTHQTEVMAAKAKQKYGGASEMGK